MWLLLFKMRSKVNKPSNAAPITTPKVAQTAVAVVGANVTAVVADVAAATVAAAPVTAVVTDLAAVVTDVDSVTTAAPTHCRITLTGIATTQGEGSVLRESCPSPACVAIFTCH